MVRPSVRGKFVFAGDEKLLVRGVTYGPFGSGDAAPDYTPEAAEDDFAAMAQAGLNAVRVYTVPPGWLLDCAARHGLYLMVGIPWEHHVAFLDERSRAAAIERKVREAVRASAGHPAVLCYAVGNEIPASIVRWYGRAKIERFLERLYRAAKDEDPDSIVTYVNFPSTEYLTLPFLDVISFNVYLEQRERLSAYMARLQNLADDLPLLMTEIGLDSRRNGEDEQARTLDWEVRTVFGLGAAGAFAFAWTDEWHRGGYEIKDWDFGLTTRDRRPKPALAAVAAAYRAAPLERTAPAPRISVIVCSYNGAATIRDCLDGLDHQTYDDFEVIVVSDGSIDATAEIARGHSVRVIETPNRGLAAARNTGLAAAGGEIVAYIDDDVRPDPDWLAFVAHAFETSDWDAVGGPNVSWPDAGEVAQCVANAPGGPTHVLFSDTEAEHIPGCNMAFRRSVLEAMKGFDPQFHAAGDDVDLCWRLLDAGYRIGFHPGASVWHHRRRSVTAYFRQQRGYGRAEALLERKWPAKYSSGGHVDWSGRLYGNGSAQHRGGWRWRIYFGGWGSAPFQSIYGPSKGLLESLPLMPEWYLVIAALTILSAGGAAWKPLLSFIPLLVIAIAALVVDAGLGALRARFQGAPRGAQLLRLRLLTGTLYLLQPLARLEGRVAGSLTPWRRRGPEHGIASPWRTVELWSEEWHAPEDRLEALVSALGAEGSVAVPGGDWDRWDLHVRGGPVGAVRVRTATEEHGSGRQLVRVRRWPYVTSAGRLIGVGTVVLAAAAYAGQAFAVAAVFAVLAAVLIVRVAYECAAGSSAVDHALTAAGQRDKALGALVSVERGER